METLEEKQQKKIMEDWEKIVENIGLENFSMIVKILEERLNQKSEEPFNEPFREIEFPYNKKVAPNITVEDIDNLKYSEEVTEINRTFRLYFNEGQLGIKGHINVKSQKIDVTIPLSSKKKREFLKKYNKEKSLLCKGCITYNVDLGLFSIFNLEIYKISVPFEKWKNLMIDKKLKERFEILLTILGLKPDVLLYHEKLMSVIRLIPLVVKKTFMVEISTKEIGKTHFCQFLGFNLYNTDVTKATTFVDGRNKKGGDFFYENIAYIIDEFHKIKQAEEIITPIQLYMSGDKYEGIIQISMEDKRVTSVSPIILANAKINIPLLDLFIKNQGKVGKPISLFDNTSILSSSDGEAFISRITLLPNSWGCRSFSSTMKSEKIDFYNIELLKEVIPVLRNKEFDMKKFYENMKVNISSTNIRGAESVEKNFEGLVKLLFPELLDDINTNEINKYSKELRFLFERAMELRKTVENQLKIINSSDNADKALPPLNSDLKNVMFNITEPYIFTAHRIFINHQNNDSVEKIALDRMGIELNKREAEILKRNGKNYILKEITLVHSLNDNSHNLSKSGVNWGNISYDFAFSQQKFFSNFNFLVGEEELIDKNVLDTIQKYSFYDLI